MTDNITAFLKLIRWCENYPHEPSEKNYSIMFGGGPITDLSDHPRKKVTKWHYTSSAAGAYGITEETYDEYKKKLGLTDFRKDAQDKIAIALIKHARAWDLVNDGKIEQAIPKLTGRWSSLPSGKQTRISMSAALLKFDEYKKQ